MTQFHWVTLHSVTKLRTCLERLSLVWACWVCWVCCVSVRPCCPAALLRRVCGWELVVCSSVEQEALDELSSTDASDQGENTHKRMTCVADAISNQQQSQIVHRSHYHHCLRWQQRWSQSSHSSPAPWPRMGRPGLQLSLLWRCC